MALPKLGLRCNALWVHLASSHRGARQPAALDPALILPAFAASAHDIVAVLRRDSDLEAFSRNPTDGSFAPLVSRPST